jgi:probable HAF family extracellular repeat protein
MGLKPVALLASGLFSLAVQAAAPHYRVELIGDPAVDGVVFGEGLNNLGQVAGMRFIGATRAPFIYQDGRMTTPDFSGQIPVFNLADINDRGDLGGALLKNNFFVPFVYRNGQLEDLSLTLGPNYGQVYAINQAGHAVGYSTSPQNTDRSFFYDGKHIQLFDEFSLSFVDVNDHDVIIYSHGYIVDHGKSEQVPPLSQTFDIPNLRAINNSGEVVGISASSASDAAAPFLYSGGVMHNLGSLGGHYGAAQDINDAGTVVGQATTQAGDLDAFVYRDGAMSNLEDLLAPKDQGRWDFEGARAINERGQILVSFHPWLETGYRSALLTPVPEMQTWALLLAGLGVVGAAAGRRRHGAD